MDPLLSYSTRLDDRQLARETDRKSRKGQTAPETDGSAGQKWGGEGEWLGVEGATYFVQWDGVGRTGEQHVQEIKERYVMRSGGGRGRAWEPSRQHGPLHLLSIIQIHIHTS